MLLIGISPEQSQSPHLPSAVKPRWCVGNGASKMRRWNGCVTAAKPQGSLQERSGGPSVTLVLRDNDKEETPKSFGRGPQPTSHRTPLSSIRRSSSSPFLLAFVSRQPSKWCRSRETHVGLLLRPLSASPRAPCAAFFRSGFSEPSPPAYVSLIARRNDITVAS